MINPSEVTFVVPIFNLKEDRINNLKFVIPYIQKTGCRILVTEQTDKDESELSNIINEFNGVEHVLFKTPEKRFHKSGIINYAVFNHVDTKYVWVNDVDFYMRYGDVFKLKWEEKFIQPYNVAKKLNSVDSGMLLRGNRLDINFSDTSVKYISMYGALSFIFDVDEFIKIGAMDESIYGWGYEDVELSKRVSEKYSVQKMQYKGIHLWHPVTSDNRSESFNINKYFDNIYCLNLDRRVDRWSVVEKKFESLGICVERFSAVDKDNFSEEEHAFLTENREKKEYMSITSSGVLGCLYSHRNIILDAKNKGYKKILIFEDDVIFSNDFKDRVGEMSQFEWKMLYLGASQFYWDGIEFVDKFYLSKKTLGTFAYAVDCSVYDDILTSFNTRKMPADNLLGLVQEKHYGACYTFYPNIVIADVTESDIRDSMDMVVYGSKSRWPLVNFGIPDEFTRVDGGTEFNNFDEKVALGLLIELDRIFKNTNTEYWISGGTLLGFVRDGNFIKNDYNINIGVSATCLNSNLIHALESNHFRIKSKKGKLTDGFELLLCKNDIEIYISFFYRSAGKVYCSSYAYQNGDGFLKHDYIFKEFILTRKNFLGYEFSIPQNPEDYIIQHYGINFKYNTRRWRYAEGPVNVVCSGKRINEIDAANDFDQLKNKEINENVTFLIKSFLRRDLVENLIKSIRKFYLNVKIVVVDDSDPAYNFDHHRNVKTYNLEFDSGVSIGRNFGLSKIETKYFVLLDDDFEFTEDTHIKNFYDVIERNDVDIIGGQVINDGAPIQYFGNFVVDDKNKTVFTKFGHENMGEYKKCQLILNFFIAKTYKIRQYGWDPELKTTEHSAFFYEHRDSLKVGFIENVSVLHKRIRETDYKPYRNRGMKIFKEWLNKKNIRHYINYANELTTSDVMVYSDKKLDTWLALKNLSDIDSVLRKFKAPYWIQDGTLLGYYRENNFISHDLDTDIGMMFEDFSFEIMEEIKKLGFSLYHTFGYPNDSFEASFTRYGIKTDIFFYYKKNDKIYHCAFKQNRRIDYYYDKFNLKEIDFLGIRLFAPVNELKFITTKYGENWKTPDTSWDWAYSPKNHVDTGYLIDPSEQKKRVKNWHATSNKKSRIVITYGTFDTFHYGHLELIRRAKQFGDKLIVGLSTDDFNKAKGKQSRFSYNQRKEWLQAIALVDEIIPETNWEQKVCDIKTHSVDVMVMGDDWVGRFDNLPCRVIYINRTPEISSTKIKKMTE